MEYKNIGTFATTAARILNNTNYLSSTTSFINFTSYNVVNLGLNKVSTKPMKLSKNSLVCVYDNDGIVMIDTSGTSNISDYFYIVNSPYQKISSNSSINWRLFFRTVTYRTQIITINKTYDTSGEFSIWPKVNGNRLKRLQCLEVLASIKSSFLNFTLHEIKTLPIRFFYL